MKVLNSRLPSLDLVSRRKITPFFASNRYWTEIFYTFLDPLALNYKSELYCSGLLFPKNLRIPKNSL